MKLTTMMMIVAAASARAEEIGSRPERRISVCMNANPDSNIPAARFLAAGILGRAGVWIKWSCMASLEVIKITLSDRTAETDHPGALAYARPFEGIHIVVFYDRIQRTTPSVPVRLLLAYVLVHEITHILQSVDRHSATGIMRARWGSDDYFEMMRGSLGFTWHDMSLIHAGLDARASSQVASKAALVALR